VEPGRLVTESDHTSAVVPEGVTRCGFIAVIGAPNAGKSTLINTLVGSKVSIVSRKVQTTRSTVRGIAIEGTTQLVFVDTPGIFAPRRRLDRAMVEAAWRVADDADLVVLLVDAAKRGDGELEAILARLKPRAQTCRLVLNKIDRAKKEVLLVKAQELNARVPFAATFMISALEHSGVADLKTHLAAAVPEGPWHFPPDEISDTPMRLLAAEITREKLYERLHQELPYHATVETVNWKERQRAVRIDQTIYVARESHKRIVLGKGGRMIKQLSMDARQELAGILAKPVELFLFVKVRADWEDDPERYREIGLAYPER
jgi:GTP-binding protein Era